MFKKSFKLQNGKYAVFETKDDNELGKQIIECFNKSIPAFPVKQLDKIDTKEFWQKTIENFLDNRNSTYIISQVIDNIVTPIEVEILKTRNYPTDIKNIMKYMCKEIINGRVDDWNDTNNLRVRTSEVFSSLIQKQVLAAYNEYKAKRLGGDTEAKLMINPTKVISAIVTSQNVNDLENINPLEELSAVSRITPIGIGGIPTGEAWPHSAMNIHHSYYGNVDPLETSNSDKIGIIQHLTIGSAITNVRGLFSERDTEKISPLEILSVGPALVPFLEHNEGARVTMATGQAKQSIPLKTPEVPAIQSGFESVFTDLLSDYFIKKSPVNGEVTEVTDLNIVIKENNTNKIYTVDITPVALRSGQGKYGLGVFNPIVKPREKVKKNQIIAEGANIKDGIISNGINILCGFMSYFGYNFEDGMVVSESTAKRFTSVHLETQELYLTEDDDISYFVNLGDQLKKGDIMVTYSPTVYDVETLQHLRSDGGKVVNIEIFSNIPEENLPEAILPAYNAFKDRFIKLNGKYPVGHFKDRGKLIIGMLIKITVQQELPVVLGDKLNLRFFNKGVVSCLDSSTYVFTDFGWKLFKDLNENDKVAYMKDNGKAGFIKPTKFYEADYSGLMYGNNYRYGVDYLVTPNHRMYYKNSKKEDEKFNIVDAETLYSLNQPIIFSTNADFELDEDKEKYIEIIHKKNKAETYIIKMNKKDYYSFYGWLVTEGCIYNGKYNSNRIIITQSKEKYRKEIIKLLDRIGLNYYNPKKHNDNNFIITNKTLYNYFINLGTLGKSWEKEIPEDMFHTSKENLKALFDAMIMGDGSTRKPGVHGFYSTSRKLIEQFCRLSVLLGYRTGKIMKDTLNRKRPKYYTYVNCNEDQSSVYISKKNHHIQKYNDKIYCVSVPNEMIFVKRNGMPFWTGNTIVPDDKMPRLPNGEPLDMVYSTLSIINRMNPGQLFELHCGLISRHLARLIQKQSRKDFTNIYSKVLDLLDGTPTKIYSKSTIVKLKTMSDTMYNNMVKQVVESKFVPLIFPPFKSPTIENVLNALKLLGLKTKYPLYIPDYDMTTNPVAIGYMYVSKLEHQSEKKIHARSTGSYLTGSLAPPAGKSRDGGAAMGEYDIYSLLSYDAKIVVDELFGPMSSDHGSKNEMIADIINTGTTNFRLTKSNPVKEMFKNMLVAIHVENT